MILKDRRTGAILLSGDLKEELLKLAKTEIEKQGIEGFNFDDIKDFNILGFSGAHLLVEK